MQLPKGISDNDAAVALIAEFLVVKNVALYNTFFKEPETWFFPPPSYLHTIGSVFINALSRTANLEVLRERVVPKENPMDPRKLFARTPFIPGS